MLVDLSRYRKGKRTAFVPKIFDKSWREGQKKIDDFYVENHLNDHEVPWWSVSLLPLEPGTDEYKCRTRHQQGWRARAKDAAASDNNGMADVGLDWAFLWADIVQLASDEWGGANVADAVREDTNACRFAALSDPRAFVQFVGLVDDDLEPWVLKDFHVKAIYAMRRSNLSCVLLPFAHGKSALSSIVVPLMDWAENAESTQIRIYHSGNHTKYWTRKLQAVVESNEALHQIFPWVDRPRRGDPCADIWSTDGFSIRGKTVVDPSFRPLTAGSSIVGVRADRVGADDWVNEFNSSSFAVQEKYYNYFKTGVLTMRRKRVNWSSPFGTKWGTTYIVGTLFDRRDINYRIFNEFSKTREKGDKTYYTMRVPVYPYRKSRESGEVIWPEKRPIEYVKQLEIDLGRRAFMMRCMNRPQETDETVFTERMLEDAKRVDLGYGVLPDAGRFRILVAYDPASGNKNNRHAKYPAAVLMAQNIDTEELHFIRYERWPIPQPRQVERLIEWAHQYDCPIYVESNNIQSSYRDWIRDKAPDVRVHTHYTSDIKHDAAAGVESLLPLFEASKVRIHTGGAEDLTVREFVTEFIEWPQGRYCDMVMAAWIGRHNLRDQLRHLRLNANPTAATYKPLHYERGFRRIVSLAKYK